MITQSALPPHTMRCSYCGLAWEPPNARGKDTPTGSSLNLQAHKHWAECEARPRRAEP